ncbi:MAG: DUF4190 domain-containing protein [Candidatus Dormibacteraceae bacterium]
MSAPPTGRQWDPGPAPAEQAPPFQPLTSPPAPAPYSGPNYAPPATMYPAGTNGMAVASLVFGIASWIVIPLIGSVLAVILGHVARGQIRRTGEQGAMLATIGLVLGYINIALSVLGAVVFVIVLIVVLGAVAASAG